jgi:hypothetical protein
MLRAVIQELGHAAKQHTALANPKELQDNLGNVQHFHSKPYLFRGPRTSSFITVE